MRRVEIANRFALAAREAERGGKHRKAAELYAEALRVLLDGASMSRGELAGPPGAEQSGGTAAAGSSIRWAPKETPEMDGPVSGARETARAASASSDDEAELPRVG